MAEGKPKKKGNVVVWAVLGLLVLSLAGFGIGGFGGSLSSVAEVGDREITVQEYGRALQAEQRRLQEQTGEPLTVQQMRAFGLDRVVMERLLAQAALAHEAERMGLSVGDAEVAARIRATPAFQGVDGGFDREGYASALRFAGLNERTYERQVRDDAAQEILQAAVVGGVTVPDAYADTLVGWLAETRDATIATVTAGDLETGPVAPTEAELTTFLEENAERFRIPERRRITYAWITPDALAETVEIDEDALRRVYEERIDDYRRPPRVLAERLAFADADAAEAARAAIAAGETEFEDIAAERGLTLADIDQGELSAGDLDPEAAAAIFALGAPGIVGPVETSLGPALYRVNAILEATETSFEEARPDLAGRFAADAARRQIDAEREAIDDLLAGGATLEEVADETDLTLGTIDFDAEARTGIAAYPAFREAAATVSEDDFPALVSLADGGLFALRLDAVIPSEVPPLSEIRGEVETVWQEDRARARLLARAEDLAERIAEGETFEATGLTPEEVTGLARDGRLEGTPPDLIDRLFQAEGGDVIALAGDGTRAFVARLDAIVPADPTVEGTATLREALVRQTRGELASDVFEAYGQAVQARAGFSVDAQAAQAVQAQLLGG
jgi:peptidyl-prolyl cis-trans isomerase D